MPFWNLHVICCLDDCHSSFSQCFKTSQEEDVSKSLFDVHTWLILGIFIWDIHGGLDQVCQSFKDVKYFTSFYTVALDPPQVSPIDRKGFLPILQANYPDQTQKLEVVCLSQKQNSEPLGTHPFREKDKKEFQLREWLEIAPNFWDALKTLYFWVANWLVRYLLLPEPSRQASESFSSQQSAVKGIDSVLIEIRWTKYDKIQLISWIEHCNLRDIIVAIFFWCGGFVHQK